LWIPLEEQTGGERRSKDRVKTGYIVDNCIVLPPSPPSLSLSLTHIFLPRTQKVMTRILMLLKGLCFRVKTIDDNEDKVVHDKGIMKLNFYIHHEATH
jgi:hypothetical protein